MKIILLGPPGAGKGTQAEKIVENFGLVHISTGDIFRKNLKENTPLGMKAKEYMDKGLLVPDDLTVAMVKDRLEQDDCKKGYMLDGFPRTIPQAEALDQVLSESGEKLDCALSITTDYSVLVERIVGRRVCKNCGATYHIVNLPPKVEGICDKCGGPLYQRDDDKAETVTKRLEEYDQKTQPLIAYYAAKGIMREVDGQKDMSEVTKEVTAILNEFR
ncbi:MAG: adenylate kinase [Anaerofustis sp.]